MAEFFEGFRTVLNSWEATLAVYFADSGIWLSGLVFSAFAMFNSVRILAYVPQIMKAARDKNGASAISFTTWGLFFASHLTTIAYAVVCVNDLIMAMFFFGNALACGVILSITFLKRQAHARRERRAGGVAPAE